MKQRHDDVVVQVVEVTMITMVTTMKGEKRKKHLLVKIETNVKEVIEGRIRQSMTTKTVIVVIMMMGGR